MFRSGRLRSDERVRCGLMTLIQRKSPSKQLLGISRESKLETLFSLTWTTFVGGTRQRFGGKEADMNTLVT